jgi:hypothetical protein
MIKGKEEREEVALFRRLCPCTHNTQREHHPQPTANVGAPVMVIIAGPPFLPSASCRAVFVQAFFDSRGSKPPPLAAMEVFLLAVLMLVLPALLVQAGR